MGTPRRVAKRNLNAFWHRFQRDNVSEMTPEQWGEWVNALPLPEFIAMVSVRPEPKPAKPPKITPKRKDLCIRLACVAAFNLDEWPVAQRTIYEAVRELQR